MSDDSNEELMTYETLSERTGLSESALRKLVQMRGGERPDFLPTHKRGKKVLFTSQQAEAMMAYMNERTFSTSDYDPTAPALILADAVAYLNERLESFSVPLVYYYQREYQKLEPDFFLATGRGRPKAHYYIRTLDAFIEWHKAGKPFDSSRLITITETLDADRTMFTFGDGTRVLIDGDEVSVSPRRPDEKEYADLAVARLARMRAKIERAS